MSNNNRSTDFERLLRNESLQQYEPSLYLQSDESADDDEVVTPAVSRYERLLRDDPERWGGR